MKSLTYTFLAESWLEGCAATTFAAEEVEQVFNRCFFRVKKGSAVPGVSVTYTGHHCRCWWMDNVLCMDFIMPIEHD